MFVDKTWGTLKRAAEYRLALKTDCFRDVTIEVNMQQQINNAKYHSKCYRNYTAVKRPSTDSKSNSISKTLQTRRNSSMPSSNTEGLLKGSCIFCNTVRKTINRKVEPLSDCLTKDGCKSIYAAAPRLSNNERIKALANREVDLIAKEAQYHKSCRRQFFKQVEGATLKNKDVSTRQLHSTTFDALSALIEKDVIGNNKAMLSTSILELYKSEFISAGGTTDDIESYTAQALTKKIKEKFGEKISISLYDHRKGNFVYSSTMSDSEARLSIQGDDEKSFHVIRTAALHIRGKIQAMSKSVTPTPTSVETLKLCSPDLPNEILLFFKTLLCGLREPSGVDNSEAINRKVIGMSSDAVYNASRGTVKPWKHTLLGLGLGTLTGSKLVLRILNRMGHSVSYDEVKSLETEFAFSAEANNRDSPDGLDLSPIRGTGLAWDNYDVNMDTIDGKDTLHATVGICYQNIENEACTIIPDDTSTVSGIRIGRKRRQFDGKEREIEPYYKQLKKARFHLEPKGSQEDEEEEEEENIIELKLLDFYWLTESQVDKKFPLFPGFCSQFIHDHLPQQRIWYMDPISAPPTRNDVVRETMKRSMNVANETGQEYGVVTYDLAVALKAYSIQALDAPLCDKLLIMLGNFHLEMAFYGAIILVPRASRPHASSLGPGTHRTGTARKLALISNAHGN